LCTAKSTYGCGSSLIKADAAIEDTIYELGLENLKPKQRDGIQSFLSGNAMLVVLLADYGKPIIYASLPLIFDKLRY